MPAAQLKTPDFCADLPRGHASGLHNVGAGASRKVVWCEQALGGGGWNVLATGKKSSSAWRYSSNYWPVKSPLPSSDSSQISSTCSSLSLVFGCSDVAC